MHIICPHCTTSYAVDLATLGVAGRTVRCSRCKEVWLARPEDAIEAAAPVAAMAEAGDQAAAGRWDTHAEGDNSQGQEIPVVESPSISGDWPASVAADGAPQTAGADWPQDARDDLADSAVAPPRRPSRFRTLLKPPGLFRAPGKSFASLPTACAAMGALVLALMIWRVEVVRLLPQTATFYKMVGFDVNVRGLAFKDMKITTETVDGKPILVIEGVIVGEGRQAVELPRLRFSVSDAHGAEIYAWNAVLDQPVLKPGERAWFKSRLASPPPEGRNIDVRFFSKHDIAAGRI
ncbi:MAG: zinc-ribbon domain-containing protein [Bradyrhizobium sp.]|nr:zinc-ribbon domain-containing protein [Bradyrhizobium sp.]